VQGLSGDDSGHMSKEQIGLALIVREELADALESLKIAVAATKSWKERPVKLAKVAN